MKKFSAIIAISALAAGCASDPEHAALARREQQIRERPALLQTSRPAQRPPGRGPLETPPPAETPAAPPITVAAVPRQHGHGSEPGMGYDTGRFLIDVLAVGSAIYLSTTAPDACRAD